MDLSKLSTPDLEAMLAGDLSKVSTEGLELLQGKLKDPPKAGERFMQGLKDPIDGGAQLLANAVPDSVEQAINSLNNWLADRTGAVGRLPAGGMNQLVAETQQRFKQDGVDWPRLAGNVLSPANVALASRVPAAATVGGRMAAGAGAGGAMSGFMPVEDSSDFWSAKGGQVAGGAAFGAALPIAGAGVRAMAPDPSSPAVRLLREGVSPTVGQMMGGVGKRLEDKAISLPLLGEAIRTGRNRAVNQFNEAAINRVLSPIGESLPKGMQPGTQAVRYASEKVSDAYNSLLPNLVGVVDNQFSASVGQIRSMAQFLPKQQRRDITKMIDDDVLGRFTAQGRASGDTLKEIQAKLNDELSTFSKSTDPYNQKAARAIETLLDEVKNLIDRSNPQYSGELSRINTAFANLVRVQRAAGAQGARTDDGVFSAANLSSAVKAGDRSARKNKFAQGEALMQDLSDAGKVMLGDSLPNSTTADRLLFAGATAGTGYALHPGILAAELATTAPYLPGVQRLMAEVLSRRFAPSVGNALDKATPFALPLGAQVAPGLLNYGN